MLQVGYKASMRQTQPIAATSAAGRVAPTNAHAKRVWQPPVVNKLSVVDTTLSPKVVPSNDASLMDS